jgi:hypothetical protein
VTFEISCCKPTSSGACGQPAFIFYFSVLAAVFALGTLSVAGVAWLESHRGCAEPGFSCAELWAITKHASSRFSTGVPSPETKSFHFPLILTPFMKQYYPE